MIQIKIINFKINLSKILIFVSIVVAILFIILSIFRLLKIGENSNSIIMTNENYTTILNDCHNNIDKYIGKEITFTGYIFRVNDFSDSQFVVARDMLINDSEFRIVGFLCNFEKAEQFEDNAWVDVVGIVTKGDYHGEIPVIKVTKIKKTTTPNDVFVGLPK